MNSPPPSPAVQWVDVDAGHAGQRVDNFLLTYLKGVPKSLVYRILRTGEVRRNGGRVKAQDRLEEGDRLRIPPVRTAERDAPVIPVDALRNRIESRILFEDEDLIVLNKPSGIAVHGGSGLSYGVIEALRAMRPEAKFLELVHRLDRETSGCLLLAKIICTEGSSSSVPRGRRQQGLPCPFYRPMGAVEADGGCALEKKCAEKR